MDVTSNDLVMVRLDGFEKLTEERFKSTAMALVLQAENYKSRIETISIEVERLRKKSDESGGKEQGAHNLWAYIIGVLGLIGLAITWFKHG